MDKIRENVLTESNIRALVKLVDEEIDGVAKEQRQKLETIEAELARCEAQDGTALRPGRDHRPRY